VRQGPPRAELEGLRLAELHAIAREAALPRYRLLRRPELVDALAGDAPADGALGAVTVTREVRIEQVAKASKDLAAAVDRLLPQLSSSSPVPTESELRTVVESDAASLLVARDGDDIVGMLTLIVFRSPTGVRGRVEDVVVDESARGRGVGEALVNEALRRARDRGARTVDLTSAPTRKGANRLYEKTGFRRRETNVYRAEPR
jgi:ribosomal protein S18 acetylase RimI-like enzyme